MNLSETGCCAVDEIRHLSEHRTAKAAMIALCEELEEGGDSYWRHENNEGLSGFQPQSFYTFTAVIKQPAPHYGGTRPKYGPQFAAFIRRNKLGVVTGSKAKYNRLNHPDHLVRHWTWAVNVRALKSWWSKNRAD